MTEWIVPVYQLLMVLTVLVLAVGVYQKAPAMFAAWIASKQQLAKLHADERERERQHQVAIAESDYKARHNDRNILMVGQSELVQQIMAGQEKALKIVSESVCKYAVKEAMRDQIIGEIGGRVG